MSTKETDAKLRKARAEELRAEIQRVSKGEQPRGPVSPREITDIAARERYARTVKKGNKPKP